MRRNSPMIRSLLLFAVLSVSFSAWAQGPRRGIGQQRRVVLDYHDEVFRGYQTLYLGQRLRDKFQRVKLRNWAVTSVTVVAKSYLGRGVAALYSGHGFQEEERVDGSPRDWGGPFSFEKVHLRNFSRRRSFPLQIDLFGKIKVRKVIVKARRKSARGPGRRPGRGDRRWGRQ